MSWTAKKKRKKSSYFTPLKYQKVAIKDGIVNNARAFFLAPGLGKTAILLEIFNQLKKAQHANYMLVVAPLLPARKVWTYEPIKWGYNFQVELLHGTKRKQKCYEEADVYVINYEGLLWLIPLMLKDKSLNWDVLVIDESSFVKNSSTKRFKNLKKILHRFNRRYILTGSPASNSYMDLWAQIYLLDKGAALGRYITHYRNEYFDKQTFETKDGREYSEYTLKKGADIRINDAIAPMVTRFGKEMLDLPPLHQNNIIIDLPEKAREVYDEMKEELFVMLKDKILTAANSGVKSQKLRQIANGGAYVTATKDSHGKIQLLNDIKKKNKREVEIHLNKAEAVLNLVEELQGEPLLVGYEFGHDLTRLLKVLPKKGVDYIGADHPVSKSDHIIDKWNAGKLKVLLGQPASIAYGANLQYAGHHVCMHSLIWSLEKFEQLYQRIWRQGQKNPVFLHMIIAENTVDELVSKVLEKKDNRQKHLSEMLTTHIKG